MPMYNLIEYSDKYSKTSESLWQYCTDEPFLDNDGAIADFFPTYDNDSALFKFKAKIAGRIGDNRIKNGKIRVTLKYLSNF